MADVPRPFRSIARPAGNAPPLVAKPRRPRGLRSVETRLLEECHAFGFFQAVRLLARLHPERKPIGRDADPATELVRFRSLPSLEFPASEIRDLILPTDESRPLQLTITFFGLIGLNGGLPHHYTEWVRQRLTQKDGTLRDFLDLFNHRLVSLFFRAWEKYRYWIPAEEALHGLRREARAGGAKLRGYVRDQRPSLDRTSQVLLDLSGLGPFGLRYREGVRHELRPRTAIADDALRHFCGLFAQQHRSAAGLEGLLGGYFRMPVEVEPVRGQWLRLDPEDWTRLGNPATGRLGETAVAGKRVWDVQSKFRVRFGELTFAEFAELLPIGAAYAPARDLIGLYAGMQFDADLELVLKADEVPQTRLGRPASGFGSRLGWTTWCRSAATAAAPGRVVLPVR